MMVVSNCYDRRKRDEDFIADCMDVDISCVQHHDVMNGEFVQVLEYGNQEVHTIPVYENKERILLPITFVDATVRLMSGKSHQCKMITEPVLSAPRGTVSVTLLKALFIDFCMRNKELRKRPQSEEFKKAVQEDPYLNALRVRYGYAITGHKSQGGEWDSIFVDFDGVHYSEPGARWIYTAITRARKHIYTINSVYTTPIHRLDIRTITRAATINEYYPSPLPVDSITSPFHTENDADYLKNKYAEVAICLNQSEYQVQSIEHLPYRERYTIHSANGLSFRVDYMYKKNGIFSHPTITPNNPELAHLLSSPLVQAKVYPPLDYEPSNNTAQYLFEVMSQLCDDVQVDILNVVERLEHYQIIYCLNTASDYAWITFFVNAKGLITYGAPQAQDINDEKLIQLIDKIQQLTEHPSPSSTSSSDSSIDCIHDSLDKPTESPKKRILFFDTECNGLPANYHLGIEHTDNWPRLIQLAWIITDETGNILKQQNHQVIPQGFIIQPNVEQLTRISTTQALTQGKLLHLVLHEFISDLQMVDMVVGHNIDFDRHIVGCELYRSQMDYATMMSKPHVCTMKQSTDYYHIQTGNDRYPKLMNLYQLLFHESFDNAHNAMADVLATMKCYFELKKRLILP
jgi:DNA polymerase III epsilon subunit-like protein